MAYDDIKYLSMCWFAFHFLCILLPNLCGDYLLWGSTHVFFGFLVFLLWEYYENFLGRTIPSQLLDPKFPMELIIFLPLFQEQVKKRGLDNKRIEFSDHCDYFRDRQLVTQWNLHWCCPENNRFSFLLNLNWYKVRGYFGVLRLTFRCVEGEFPPHYQVILWTPAGCPYNSTQFWHALPGYSLRSYRLRGSVLQGSLFFPLQMPVTSPGSHLHFYILAVNQTNSNYSFLRFD